MEQNAANELIKLYAKQLRLPSFNKYAKVVQQLEPNESYADFLLKLMKTELDDRQHTAQEKNIQDVSCCCSGFLSQLPWVHLLPRQRKPSRGPRDRGNGMESFRPSQLNPLACLFSK